MNHFRKFASMLLAAAMLAGCSSASQPAASTAPQESAAPSEAPAETAKTDEGTETLPDSVTFDELLEKGRENGKTVKIYSTHSVIVTACEAFAVSHDIDPSLFECSQIGDNDQITQVATEVSSGAEGADLIFIQDGARVYSDLVVPGYVYNWYNQEIADMVGARVEPLLVWDYCNKVLIYNSDNVKPEDVSNIWYLTDPQYKGTFQIKDPTSEGVNMDFLTEITNDENAQKLADAYKAYYGKDIELDSDCENAGYQFIKMMYENGVVLTSSDGDTAQAIGAEGQSEKWSALITLNKYKKNLDKGYKLAYASESDPFAGFIYPIYALQTANADNPDLAKAFLVWMYTNQGWTGCEEDITLSDGSVYKGMSGRFGDYSANTANAVMDGDMELEKWEEILVNCDPQWDSEHRADVEDFISMVK